MNGFPLLPGDALRVRSYNTIGVMCNMRITAVTVSPAGEQRVSMSDLVVMTEGTDYLIPLPAGTLLMSSVQNIYALAQIEFRVSLELLRPMGAPTPIVVPLVGGFLRPNQSMGWIAESGPWSLQPYGFVRLIAVADPAAGANAVHNAVYNGDWVLESVRLRFVTSATVAARAVELQLYDPAGNAFLQPPATTQGASFTYSYRWDANRGRENIALEGSFANLSVVQFHGLVHVETLVTNLQVGDQLSQMYLTLRPLG